MELVRMAQPDDIDALTRMRFGFSREYDSSISEEEYGVFADHYRQFLQKAFAVQSDWKIWVSEVDGNVIAHTFVHVVEKVPRPGHESYAPFGYVTNACTLPDYRDKGIGTRLLQEIRRWSTENRLDFLIVWPSERSVRFYSRNGFSPCKEAMELPV